MPILELFAGYGGLGLAVESLTGERVRFVAENDQYASQILAERYPDAPNLGDVTEIDWASLIGVVDIITAGFPCQGISNAGLRRGFEDERSATWFNVIEAIRVLRPRIVFLENVAAIRGRGLAEVLGGLASAGYDAKWCCYRASAAGAPHHRDRWFCVAVPENPDSEPWGEWRRTASGQAPWYEFDSPSRGGGGESSSRKQPHGSTLADEVCFLLPHSDRLRRIGRAGWLEEQTRGPESPDSCHSPAAWWGNYLPVIRRWERLTGVHAPAPTEIGPRGGIRVTAAFAEWLMGLSPQWVTGVPGLTRGQQLKAIGNGVCPPQAYAAYRHLLMGGA
ncbi:DNA cytosine methyltransferase [Streptomyces sp. NBC_00102]|uniref:DNA cytosine methyltransferase n=1 Tax=Streptomyces sp. NBC_00102 TaxID=2975652 RepID=UPI002250F842|nr:DNA (cytosine-5-)-methyltransferase [Streptomyces sp. NBC_00102]MCX5398478.1 DNA (cytosine-5-)-methyltransferase [Streptomyces sp. NBC_00102]